MDDESASARGRVGPTAKARTELPDVWAMMMGIHSLAGAAFGFVLFSAVEFDESREMVDAASFGLPGLVAGGFAGLLLSIAPAAVLTYLQNRTRASIALTAAATAATAAAVATLAILVASGTEVSGQFLLGCAVAAALTSGLTATWLGRRRRQALRGPVMG